jgi:hypothetical protein
MILLHPFMPVFSQVEQSPNDAQAQSGYRIPSELHGYNLLVPKGAVQLSAQVVPVTTEFHATRVNKAGLPRPTKSGQVTYGNTTLLIALEDVQVQRGDAKEKPYMKFTKTGSQGSGRYPVRIEFTDSDQYHAGECEQCGRQNE